MHVAQKRRRIIEAARRQGNLRLPASRAVRYALIDKTADAVELHLRHDGADVNCFIERRADTEGAHSILNLGDQNFGDTLLHQQSRTRATDLALIEPDSIDEAFDCAVEVGIFK